jgi:hypothetical protein
MRIPIRTIGIATTVFWIFLIAFFVSAAYSARDIQFNFGDPQTGMNADNELFFSLPITIINKGFYNIGNFNVTSRIADRDGLEITHGSTLIPIIRRDEEIRAFHNVTLDVNDLLQRDQNYLFKDGEIRIHETVDLKLAEIIPVQAEANSTVPWGAPLYNFVIGEPQYLAYNTTHFKATVSISFENHAFFDLTGSIQLQMYNNANRHTGYGETAFVAPQHARCDGAVEFYVPISGVTSSGRFEAYVFSPLFSCGPWVIPYG